MKVTNDKWQVETAEGSKLQVAGSGTQRELATSNQQLAASHLPLVTGHVFK